MHYAASIGHTDYVNLLLEKKADPGIRDRQGKTQLEIAIDSYHYYVKEYFLTDNHKEIG
ncbi:ankyrin repeat domain-containing protein [Wolbachia endosymbiont of Mansonella perstans]|nr:ankyrin repeat domain-containing protein [Wolbachia endosymbiont of Mansonella perstans]